MLVMYDEGCRKGMPHPHASRWFQMGENSDILPGLPPLGQAALYGSAVGHAAPVVEPGAIGLAGRPLESPTQFLDRLSPRARVSVPPWRRSVAAVPSRRTVLSKRLKRTATLSRPTSCCAPRKCKRRLPSPRQNRSLMQDTLRRKSGQLCQEKGTQLVILHTPMLDERNSSIMPEGQYWPDFFAAPVAVMGIPTSRLLAGLSDSDVSQMFMDSRHLTRTAKSILRPSSRRFYLELYAKSTHVR